MNDSLDVMYAKLRRMSNYNNSQDEAVNNLIQAYNSLIDACDLSKYFQINDVSADNNEIVKQRESIMALVNDIKQENSKVQYAINKQRQTIRNEKYRIDMEKTNSMQEGN